MMPPNMLPNTKTGMVIVVLLLVAGVVLALQSQTPPIPYVGSYDLEGSYADRAAGVGGSVETMGLLAQDAAYESTGEESAILTTDSYIIYTGSVDMRVDSVSDAMASLEGVASTNGGYIEYSYIDRSDEYVDGYATLRVTADRFATAMSDIQNIATSVYYVQVSSDDITEQVVDLQARLENARAEEQSYLEVLEIATSVEDILDVRYYLSQVRETIERYEAQLEYYESVTSLATITVSMTEEVSILLESDTFRPGRSVIEALQTVVRLGQGAITAIIWIVIVGGAVAIVMGLLSLIVRPIYRRFRK